MIKLICSRRSANEGFHHDFPPLTITSSGAVQTWTIDNQGVGNAITGLDFIEAFERAVHEANRSTEVRAVILTGAGKIFSSGGNVKEMADAEGGMFGLDPRAQRRAYVDSIQRIPRALDRLEVAIIAAVNGPAIGAGCDLAMMCDLRVASEKASFAESFVQIGLIPGDGGTWFLPQAIGYERAALMTLTGERIDAATAKEWNMISTLVPHDDLLSEAMDIAERIAENPLGIAADGQAAVAGVQNKFARDRARHGCRHAATGPPRPPSTRSGWRGGGPNEHSAQRGGAPGSAHLR